MSRLGSIALLLLFASCKQTTQMGGCDPKTFALGPTWSDFGPAPLDGTEVSACSSQYSMSFQYRDQSEERQVKRITDFLQSKGYREVTPHDAAHAGVSPTPPRTDDGFSEMSNARVFATAHDQISVVVLRYPRLAGHPFTIDLGRFITAPAR